MASAYWHQTLAAGFAGQDITSSALHTQNRQIQYGGQYLVGSHFIRFLAETYGEEKLWEIIDRQSSSVLFPLGVNLRFWLSYGKSLHTLIGEFSEHIEKTYPQRSRRSEQHQIRALGQAAQWAVAPDGTQVAITRSPDTLEELTIWSADGKQLFRRALPDMLPPRKLIQSSQYSGLSFTADSKHLYFTTISQGVTARKTQLIHLDLKTYTFNIIADNLRGAGGDITPDEKRYIFPRANGSHHDLANFDLKTREIEVMHAMPAGSFVVSPRVSPDGKRIAAIVMHGARSDIWLFSATTGKKLAEITGSTNVSTPRAHRDPTWLDNHTLLASTEIDQRLQIVRYDLDSGQSTQLSDAPYLAVQPFAIDANTVGFLNRDGWNWTLDTLPATSSKIASASHIDTADTRPDSTNDDPKPTKIASSTLLEDAPYSQFDGLFIPRLRTPMLSWSDNAHLVGAAISGHDTLAFHVWSVEFIYDFLNRMPSFSAQYLNAQLAPWYLYFTASQNWVFNLYSLQNGGDANADLLYRLGQRERQFSANISRQFYDIPMSLSLLGTELYRPKSSLSFTERRRFLGAKANARFAAGRASAYGGTRELFALDLTAAAFPEQVGSNFSLGDLRAETTIMLPLPFSNLHRLRINARARSLLGTPDNANLLRVGGTPTALVLYNNIGHRAEPLTDIVPRDFKFSESLRGYEDYGFTTNQLFAAEIDYRYPFIIDAGTASTLEVFPSLYLRQINFELFASAATFDFDGNDHAATGASLDLQWQFWLLGFELRYQAAKRLLDDGALVHTVTLNLGV